MGLRAEQVSALLLLANCALARNMLRDAAEYAIQAQAVSAELDDSTLQVQSAFCAARLSFEIGDFEQSLSDLESVRQLALDGGETRVAFSFYTFTGNIHLGLKQYSEAIDAGELSLRIARSLQDERCLAVATGNLAGRWFEWGERLLASGDDLEGRRAVEHALRLSTEAIEMAISANAPRMNIAHFSNHAGMLAALDRAGEAQDMFRRFRELSSSLNDERASPSALEDEAQLLLRQNRVESAREMVHEAIGISERLGRRNDLPSLYELASSIDEQQGRYRDALGHYKAMHRIHTEMSISGAAQRSLVMSVRLATERAQREAATERERADALRLDNLGLKRRAESLTREALEDPLTGLANRRQLDLHLADLFVVTRSNTAACVAMLDIDHFKRVNDQHSHAVGDAVLRQFAGLLREHCRADDLAARVGGEEFMLCFKGIDLPPVMTICERVRSAVENFDWASVSPGLQVSVSIGVANLASCKSISEAIAAADAMLYEAKSNGRNRVCSATPADSVMPSELLTRQVAIPASVAEGRSRTLTVANAAPTGFAEASQIIF